MIIVNFHASKLPSMNSLEDKKDFQHFLQEWENIYELNEEFQFIFDTRKTKNASITYIPSLVSHMIRIRKEKEPYLTKVIVQLNSEMVQTLLQMIFKIYKPFCEVVIDYQKES